jgi:hypothetical protein
MKDGDAQQVAKISGQLWLGQLLSLMTSINKWPLSLSPKSLSRSICAKACSLLQAEAAALFLVNHHAEEVILQAQYPSRPKNQRPASAATGQSAETRTNDAGNDAVGEDVRVKYGVGIIGTAALEVRVNSMQIHARQFMFPFPYKVNLLCTHAYISTINDSGKNNYH